MRFLDYIEQLEAKGKCTFTLNDAQKALNKSRSAIILSIEHLRQQGKIASPARGFYVIVFPKYRVYSCLPPEYFIPYLMEFWQEPYYVCLVTAASYHGAAHQQPQTFQVMVNRYKKSIVCGKVKIDFIVNKNMEKYPTQYITTQYSRLTIATPETTAMDLMNYPQQSGGLNRIVTILDELRESLREKELSTLIEMDLHHHWKQRLGYLLEKIDAQNLADVVFDHLQKLKRLNYIPLEPTLHENVVAQQYRKNKKWKIIENADFEGDL